MNKDLDDRLIPNGEYRDAQNVSVGKSESDDIGSLETVLGNSILPATILSATPISANNMKVIGYLSDENNGKVYVFATNYTDSNGPNYVSAPQFIGANNRCIIYSWSIADTANITLLVDNNFLNFSTTNPIQVSIIEDLLFFTDNRNQPRKINVTNPAGYYTNESQISVAKYNPYQAISLVKKVETLANSNPINPLNSTDSTTAATTAGQNIQGDAIIIGRSDAWNAYGAGVIKIQFLDGTTVATDGVSDAFLNAAPGTTTVPPVGSTVQTYQANINVTIPINTQFKFVAPIDLFQIIVEDATDIEVGMQMTSRGANSIDKVKGDQFVMVTNVTGNTVTIASQIPGFTGVTVLAGDYLTFLISTMTDKSGDATWPGDPDYIEDRYVRFSYRFQYDDGEYSLMAPFTQIAYIPKQKGYFLSGDEDAAYRSTILDWMENNVNNVELLISLPEVFSGDVTPIYKIRSLDVLYKESDGLVSKVLDTLTIAQIQNGSTANTNIFTYNYQSRKPYKTLTEDQTVRVYDKVPVRALAQETAGGRIIYGNYTDRYTPPGDIDYEVRAEPKNTTIFDNWIEYPNHTLKQNRNYQVGFVLADKFGRQSPVILSPVSAIVKNTDYLGSTFFSPYDSVAENMKNWFGDALQVIVNTSISGGLDSSASSYNPNFQTGTPGLYAIRTGDKTGFNVFDTATPPTFNTNQTQYTFTLSFDALATPPTLPAVGTYLRGEYVDYVKVIAPQVGAPVSGTTYTVTCDGAINKSIYSAAIGSSTTVADLKYAYTLNETGWYSYKVVVKQNEQDYYNVYLPGILKGYPEVTTGAAPAPIPFPADPLGTTSNIVLINDNINKVPRDLAEVGPDQKQFRSSVQLFPRVENTLVVSTPATTNDPKNNKQSFPGTSTDTAISIATTNDSNMDFLNLSSDGQANIYQIDSKPLIARLATTTAIGVTSTTDANTNMVPFLAIYETEPVDSLLDIFWETASEGLIADLNSDIDTGFEGAVSFSESAYVQLESMVNNDYVTEYFWPASAEGVSFKTNTSYSYINALPTLGTIGEISQSDSAGNVAWEMNATDNTINSPTTKFVLEQNNISGDVNRYGYRLKLKLLSLDDAFVYQIGSNQGDQYTFTFPGLKTILNGVTTDSPNLSKTGQLTNVIPDFSVTDIVADVTQGADEANPFVTYVGINGSSNTIKTQDLYWSITSVTPSANFSIGSQSGSLYQTNGSSSVGYGTYTVKVKLKDATNQSNQSDTPGFLFIERDQIITIGPQKVNDSVKSSCIETAVGPVSFPSTSTSGAKTFTAPNTSDNSYYNRAAGGTAVSGIWYLGGTGSDYTGYLTGTGDNWEGITIVGAKATENGGNAGAGAYLAGNPWRLGAALTQGTVVLSCNLAQNNAVPVSAPFPSGYMSLLQGTAQFRVYHRTSVTDTWAQIKDINNNLQAYVPADRGSTGNAYALNTGNLTGVFTSYAQIIFAFDQPGEYAILFDEGSTISGDESNNRLIAWCNSNDLHYSTCVIENGNNVRDDSNFTSTAALGEAYPFEFGFGNLAAATSSFNCNFGTNTVYSPIPYGEYVTQFFTNTSFTSPLQQTGSDNLDITKYYGFKAAGLTPYQDISTSSLYTYSARFTTADGKKFPTTPPTPDTGAYAGYCRTQNPPGPSAVPTIRYFPYGLDV